MMRVVVIGGGIGGNAVALSLHAVGVVDVDIYEKALAFREAGMGITVLPHAARELAELGLLDELAAIGIATEWISYHDRTGGLVWSDRRGRGAGYRWPQLTIHRRELLRVLHTAARERLGAARFHTGHQLVAVGQDGDQIWVDFVDPRDGAPLPRRYADMLIGADGVHSTTRRLLHPGEGPPTWSGILIFKGLTERPRYLDGHTTTLTGNLTGPDPLAFAAYPISREHDDRGRSLMNWGGYVKVAPRQPLPDRSWDFPDNRAEALARFAGWRFGELDAPALIAATREVLVVPMIDRDPLPHWSSGRMTLLGDAAHPMYPAGSNGASQAVLDARVLARELASHDDVETALACYDAERRPATSAVVLANRVGETDAACLEIPTQTLSNDDLVELSARYKRIAGYDVETLNARPSHTPALEVEA